MPVSTIGASMSTFVSQNRGAGNKDRIRKGIRTACIMDVCWGVTAIIILFPFARNLVTLFGSTQDVILDNSALYLRFTAPFYAVLGIRNFVGLYSFSVTKSSASSASYRHSSFFIYLFLQFQ